jgi:hypothetical protein
MPTPTACWWPPTSLHSGSWGLMPVTMMDIGEVRVLVR